MVEGVVGVVRVVEVVGVGGIVGVTEAVRTGVGVSHSLSPSLLLSR